jgi:hypothetical protein
MSRVSSRLVHALVLSVFMIAAGSALAAGPAFIVERRVSIPKERFSELHWAPAGGELAARTFRTVAIIDAASGEADTFSIPAVEHVAWSPDGRWLALRSTPSARASGRERRDRVYVVESGKSPGAERVRTIVDTTLVRVDLRHPVAWKGDALLATMQDSAWFDHAVVPGAAPKEGLAAYWLAPPAMPGSSERVYVGVIGADGRFETREIPPPPSTMHAPRIDPARPISRGWSPIRMTPGGGMILATAREAEGEVYMILGADGSPRSRFDDGLGPTDLSTDGQWILAQAEVVGPAKLEGSELFLVRAADGKAFPLTGTGTAIETDAVFEPGTLRVACIDQADGAALIGRIEGLPEDR